MKLSIQVTGDLSEDKAPNLKMHLQLDISLVESAASSG